MKLHVPDAILAPNSIVLVTGANGLIASHACDQLLAAGYRVRGTVRDIQKSSWLRPLFTKRHGADRFDLAEMQELDTPEAWGVAMKSVAAVVHLIGSFNSDVVDPDEDIKTETPVHRSLLEAAKREPSVKAFAMVSSAWAAWTPNVERKVMLTEDSWNEEAVNLARDQTIPRQQKGLAGLMALKTLIEQDAWGWVNSQTPKYAFNTLLLDTVIGGSLDAKNQGITNTANFVGWVWEGANTATLNAMRPQWYSNVVDAGKLFVAVVALPGIDRERIFAFGGRYSIHRVAQILRELYPGREIGAEIRDVGWDQTVVPNQRGGDLLGRLGQEGWTGLEESVRANVESWIIANEG